MNMKKFWIKMNILYEKLMLFVFVAALLVVIYGLYDSWYVFNHANDTDYLKYKPVPGESVESGPITDDMVAWISIDDTNIDYPIMQGEDNTKYLNMNPYGEYSLSGSIFLDSRNSGDFTDSYSILYGHHMEYGVMFGALDDFMNQSYLKQHNTGTLLVGRDNVKSYKLKIFASIKVNVFQESEVFNPETDQLMEIIKKKAAVYDKDIEASDHILALSTCTEPVSKNRLLVFCYIYK